MSGFCNKWLRWYVITKIMYTHCIDFNFMLCLDISDLEQNTNFKVIDNEII